MATTYDQLLSMAKPQAIRSLAVQPSAAKSPKARVGRPGSTINGNH